MAAQRSWVTGLGLAVGVIAAAACIAPRGFPCEDDEQCVLEGTQGRCEPERYCSYPDDECDGGHRYEARAPGELAGACVGGAAQTDSGTGTDDGSTGEPPVYTCDDRPCTAQGLVVGHEHGCVRDGDDVLWCWGSNASGQLGRGTNSVGERCPGPTMALPSVVQASASEHMCVLDDQARVFCWGNNEHGQVDWRLTTQEAVLVPVEVLDLGAPERLDVGPRLSCVAAGSNVTCWGELGQPSPVTIDALEPVAALATGSRHACAVVEGGAVVCVGMNDVGQLGDETPSGSGSILVGEPIVVGASQVDAGYDHTCALVTTMAGHEVQCWGANDFGQSGAPVEERYLVVETPTTVSSLLEGPYLALAVGQRHSCVLVHDGRVQCWGDDEQGQVGPDAPSGFGAHTVMLEGGEPLYAVEIGAGREHTCARTGDDGVVCWGDNGALQLGASSSDVTSTHHWLEIGCQ